MAGYLLRRLPISVLVLLLITIGVFVLVRMAPGDPVDMMIPPEQLGPGSERFIEAKREELGLNDPIWIQYWSWLTHVIRGDFGYSIGSGRPVSELIGERIGPTVELMGISLLVGLLIAIPLGTIAAVKRNTVVDYTASVVSLSAVSTPPFFLGIIAIYLFSLKLDLLPSAGMVTEGQESVGNALLHLILPVSILGFATSGILTRYVRGSVLTELHADYVRTAEAKGASGWRVVFRHVLRNAMIPVITIVALLLPTVLAGAVVIETVFSWPGMGQLAVTAVEQRDYPVIVGFAMVVGVLVLISNLLADILYTVVDPRVAL